MKGPATRRSGKGADRLAVGLLGSGDLRGVTGTVRRGSDQNAPRRERAQSVPYGATVACNQILAALVGDERIDLRFYSGRRHQARERSRLARLHLDELLQGDTPDIMFDFTGSWWRSLYARNAAGRAFPVAITHHTISYAILLGTFFVPFVIEQTHPYDVFIATSTSSLRAARALVQQAESALGRSTRYLGDYAVIPFGVDTTKFRPRPKIPARDRLNLPREAFIILCAGRLSAADKGDVLPLLRVLRRLADSSDLKRRPSLVFAGGGQPAYRRAVEIDAQNLGVRRLIHFVPSQPSSEMHRVYPAADAVICPADNVQESFGLTPVEAMACGVPQIAADWDGYRDTVVNGETGFLIPTSWIKCEDRFGLWSPLGEFLPMYDHLYLAQSVAVDVGATEAAIRSLVQSDELHSKMARASRRRAVREFDWRVIIGRYLELWRERIEIARNAGSRPISRPALRPSYFEAFSHNASRILGPRTRISITAEGCDILSGRARLPPLELYSDRSITDESTLKSVLRVLNRVGRLSMREIADMADSGNDPAAVYRHLAWLIKYGYASQAKGPSA